MDFTTMVRIEIKDYFNNTLEIIDNLGIECECYESDALFGDPETIVLFSVLGVEAIRAIKSFVVEYLKRDKSLYVSIGGTKIRASTYADLENILNLLNDLPKTESTLSEMTSSSEKDD
jgi:hypothetical protein